MFDDPLCHPAQLHLVLARSDDPQLSFVIATEERNKRLDALEFFQAPYKKEIARTAGELHRFKGILFPSGRKIRQLNGRNIQAQFLMLLGSERAGSKKEIDMFDRLFHQIGIAPQLRRSLL